MDSGGSRFEERLIMFFMKKAPKGPADTTITAKAEPVAQTLISDGYTLKGRIHGQGPVEVHGRLEGQVDIRGRVAVGSTASVAGEIKAEVLEVGGAVEGRLDISQQLILGATARVEGSAAAAGIEMAAGAFFNGDVHMKA
jgi:cytoskeletal protein CcmA (bactofilin family)